MARQSTKLGTVEKHRERWYLRYSEKTAEGWRSRRVPLTSTCRRAAREEANKRMAKICANEGAFPGLTFEEFAKTTWRSHLAKSDLREASLEAYAFVVNKHLLPFFGKMQLKEITKIHCAAFFDQPSMERFRPTTRHLMYGVLHRMLALARDFDLIDTFPLIPRLHRPRRGDPNKVVLSVDQVRLVLQKAPKERVLLALIATTGVRISELLGFQWRDVDWNAGTIKVVRQVGLRKALVPPKSKASLRTLRLAESMLEMLKAHRAASKFPNETDLIFPHHNGGPRNQNHVRDQVLIPALEAAGIVREDYKHGWHLFRHSYGTALYDATKDVKLVQSLLGHASVGITMNLYVHGNEISEASEFSATMLSDYVN